ncbi:MAG TPA: DedA family protein [Herpetosiphonaceae bacterium]
MAEIMEWVRTTIDAIISALGYVGIALVMFAENVFPPIPSELVMPFAGFQVAEGKMSFILAVVAGTVGAVLGAVVLYFVGLWSDELIVRRFVRRFGSWFLLSEEDIDRTLGFFASRGEAVVFFGRLIPIVRSLISIPAGMNRMPMWRFLIWTTAGATIWNLALTTAGYYLGANWDAVLGFVKQYEHVVLAAVLLGVAYFIFTRLRKRRQVQASAK